jgi:outer membrane protein assembly factor BamB
MRWVNVVVWLSLVGAVSAGENWPEFRGPKGDGTADDTGLPVTWSEGENVVWKTPIHGHGWSSPVVWGDEIWITTANDDGTELSYLVIDAGSGEVRHDELLLRVASPWFKETFNSFASPTPVLDAERAYLSWGSAGLVCVDRATRDVVWMRRDLECNHYRGAGSSPILFEDKVFLHYDGFDYQYIIALDKLTGDTIWWTDRPHNFGTDDGDRKKAYGTPQIIEAAGRTQLISPTSKGVFSYDPDTGEEIWRARYEEFSSATRPVFDGERVFITTGFGKAVLLAVDPTGTGDVTETHIQWREPRTMPSKPSPLLIDGLLYLFGDKGVASCLEAATGETVWQQRVGGNYSASPVYADGRIYAFSEQGDGLVLQPGREFTLVAENKLDDGCLASPAVAHGALFVRTRTHLYRLDEK